MLEDANAFEADELVSLRLCKSVLQVTLPAATGVCYDSVTELKSFTAMAVLLPSDPTVSLVISPLSTLVAYAAMLDVQPRVRFPGPAPLPPEVTVNMLDIPELICVS